MISTTESAEKKRKKSPLKVPDYLIYEVVRGKPIYYKGYKDVLNKTKTVEEIKIDSTLQAWFKARLSILLENFLIENGYEITTGEQGLILSKENKRGADLAIFPAEGFVIDEQYSRQTPEVAIEIDVKADTENTTEMDYILEKIADYHLFGVKKVIWIFTKNRKIMDAPAGEPWLTYDWKADIEVVKGLTLNLETIAPKKQLR